MAGRKKPANSDSLRYKSGHWYGRWRDASGRLRERSLSTDRAIAARKLRKIQLDRDLEKEGLGDGERQERTLEALRKCYLAELGATRRASYAESVTLSLGVVLEELGPMRVRDLTSEKVRAMRRRLLSRRKRKGDTDKRLSHRTVNMRVQALTGMLRWAEEQGEIARNPLPRIAPLPTGTEHRRKLRRSLTPEEVRTFLDTVAEHDRVRAAVNSRRVPQEPLFLTLVQTGLRSAEIRQLTWGDVDFATRTLEVRAEHAKNRKEERVDVTDELLEALRRLQVVQEALRGKIPGSEDPVFLTPRGLTWRSPTNLLRFFRSLLKKAGIPLVDDRGRDVDVHALRVTCGSLLIQAGADLRVVQAHLRHSTPALTASTYSDRRMVPVRRAIDAFGSILYPESKKAKKTSEKRA